MMNHVLHVGEVRIPIGGEIERVRNQITAAVRAGGDWVGPQGQTETLVFVSPGLPIWIEPMRPQTLPSHIR